MTRPCGCGGNAAFECNCVLIPGPNTEITGTGIPEDPYVITGSVTQLTVTDTATLDLTLAGDGSAIPYNLSGSVKLNASAGNLLQVTPTGLLVPCTAVQDCVADAMGPGLVWNAADRRYEVLVSTEPGNTVLIADDGGVYSSPDGTVQPAQPRARLGKAAPQTIPSGASTTVIAFDQPITDNAGMHTAVGRLTAPIAGGYTIGSTVQWATLPPNNGHRAVFLRLNGTQLIAGVQEDAAVTVSTLQNLNTCFDLDAGDYVEVVVQQTDSGGPISLLVSNNLVPTFWMYLTTEGV